MTQEVPVTLAVPAVADYARSVRMLAANLAVVHGMCVDSVEDIRMAAEEGFVYACASGIDRCQITFEASDAVMRMSFSLGDVEPDSEDLSFAQVLLSAICDECESDTQAGVLRLAVSCGGDYAGQ